MPGRSFLNVICQLDSFPVVLLFFLSTFWFPCFLPKADASYCWGTGTFQSSFLSQTHPQAHIYMYVYAHTSLVFPLLASTFNWVCRESLTTSDKKLQSYHPLRRNCLWALPTRAIPCCCCCNNAGSRRMHQHAALSPSQWGWGQNEPSSPATQSLEISIFWLLICRGEESILALWGAQVLVEIL